MLRFPKGLNVGQNGLHLGLRQLVGEARHSAVWKSAAFGGDIQQHLIGVMPGMSLAVVRRRRVDPISVRDLPVRLPLALKPVTGRAVGVVQRLAVYQLM